MELFTGTFFAALWVDTVTGALSWHALRLQVLLLCPNTDESEMLNGQLLEVEVASLQDTVGELKSRLAEVVGIAANKQKIGRDQLGFLRDELTLAHYNVSPDIQLTLGVKERGGRKK